MHEDARHHVCESRRAEGESIVQRGNFMFNEENKEVAQLGRVHQKGQKAPCTVQSTHTAHNRIVATAGRRSTGARQASNGEVKRRVWRGGWAVWQATHLRRL